MAQTWFNLQLHRDFPRYKTMLQGWDGQMQAETAQILILSVCQHYTSRNVWAFSRRTGRRSSAAIRRTSTTRTSKPLLFGRYDQSVKSIGFLLIFSRKGRVRDAAREGQAVMTGRQHPSRGDEQPSESIDSTLHTEIQLQTTASSASVRKSRRQP